MTGVIKKGETYLKRVNDDLVIKVCRPTAAIGSIAAGEYKELTFDLTYNGYKPIAIYAITKGGTNGGHCLISNVGITGDTTARLGIKNTYSSAATPSINMQILYTKI